MSNLSKSVFKFYFDLEELSKYRLAYFSIDLPHPSQVLEDICEDDEGDYALMISDNEEFGVHDVSYCPTDEFQGYMTTDVEEVNVGIVMTNIVNFFKTKGFLVSDIIYIEEKYESDRESWENAYDIVTKKYQEYLDTLRI